MVSKPVAAAGSVLGLTALAMLISVMVSQNFVVVTVSGKVGQYGDSKLGGAGTCQAPNYLGTLGIFKASYLPACTFNPAVVPANSANTTNLQPYARLKEVTSPTTEFGPLFPAQTCIGGLLGDCGFTTCEAFYAEGGKTDVVGAGVASNSVDAGLANANAGVASLTSLIQMIPDLVSSALGASLIGEQTKDRTLNNTVTSIQGLHQIGVGLVTKLYIAPDTVPSLVSSSLCTANDNTADPVFSSGYNCDALKGQLGLLGGCSGDRTSWPVAVEGLKKVCDDLLTLFAGATDAERIGNLAKGPSVVFDLQAISSAGKALVGSFALDCATTPSKCANPTLVSITGEEVLKAFKALGALFKQSSSRSVFLSGAWTTSGSSIADKSTFAGLKEYLRQFAFGPVPVYNNNTKTSNSLALAWAQMASCNGTSIAECQTTANYVFQVPTVALSGDTTTLAACVLVDYTVAVAANRASQPVSACNYEYLYTTLLSVLMDARVAEAVFGKATYEGLISLLGGKKITDVVPLLGGILVLCKSLGKSAATCPSVGFMTPATNFKGLPSNFNDLYPLGIFAMLFLSDPTLSAAPPAVQASITKMRLTLQAPLPTFTNFINTLALKETADLFKDYKAVLPAGVGSLGDLIAPAQLGVNTTDASGFAAKMYPLFYDSTGLINSTSRATRISDCLNNDKDISAFKTAQSMVTAAAVMMGLGMAAGFAALAVDKGPVAFGAGALSAIGGVLVVAALMVVKGAPVYAKIGGTPVDGKPLYSAASGQLIAIVGGLLAIVGGITQAVSGCLNKAGSSSDQLTTKVENTY